MELTAALNAIAGTTGLEAQGAANVIAGTDGLALVGALNVAATPVGVVGYQPTKLGLPGTSGNYATAPDDASFAITDVDFRVYMSMNDWTPSSNVNPAGQWNGTGNQRGWQIDIDTIGRFSFIWSTDGTYNPGVTYLAQQVSTANSFTNSASKGLRFLFDVDNGASGRAFSVYHRDDDDIESSSGWTQLGSTNTTAGATTIHNSTASLDLGACNNGGHLAGTIHKAVLLDGINGAAVANPNFTSDPALDGYAPDGAGNTWTLNGTAALVDNGAAVEEVLGVSPNLELQGVLNLLAGTSGLGVNAAATAWMESL